MTEIALALDSNTPLPEGPARLLSSEEEARCFARLQWSLFRTKLRHTLATSRLRVGLVTGLSLFFWVGLFLLFYEGFRFLSIHVGIAGELHSSTVHFIYFSFFTSLMVMLIFSSAIISYSGLFRSPETQFLLTLPARENRIVLYKFQESLLFSSWGFFLLGSPMLVAYGVATGSPWHYYALLVPYMLSFVFLPCALGSIACLLVVYAAPRLRWLAAGLLLLLFLGSVAAFGWSFLGGHSRDLLSPEWFKETLSRLTYIKFRLLPSWWLSTGVLEASRTPSGSLEDSPLAESILLLATLLSNSMLAYLVLLHIGQRTLRTGYSGLHGESQVLGPWIVRGQLLLHRVLAWRPGRTPAESAAQAVFTPDPWQLSWMDRILWRVTWVLPLQVRLLLVKDMRVFRRDPVQWSQVVILFGLLALYFVNIRRFSHGVAHEVWVNMVSFLNLAVVGLILSTFTTRFIFPMISLEGSRFWILGLLPIRRDAILWGKFCFAAAGAIIPCNLLILLSDLMLGVSLLVLLAHQVTCIIVCVGLAGIAVGLGAKMPDMREQSPSKIAAGFGGTLNLVVSAIYIVVIVMLTALPCHFYVAAANDAFPLEYRRAWVFGGMFASLSLGIFATFFPLQLGLRAFRKLEF